MADQSIAQSHDFSIEPLLRHDKRMRLHRQRRRYGIRPISMGIDTVVIEALVKVKYLKTSEAGDSHAIAQAVIDFLTDN